MKLLREYIRVLLEQAGERPIRKKLDLHIPSDLQAIHRRMKLAGKQLYIVGGAVRDTLMHKTPKDYDLATDAEPEKIIHILQRDPHLRIDLTGKSFGVIRVKTPEGSEYEIATFREDIGKGRRPDAVKFTTIGDDVKRRDLTVNALFYDMDTGEAVDYVGGIKDIEDGVIRAVGDPAERFDEDKLRILRAVRFAGRMGAELDPATKAAILADNTLTEVAPQRIHDEFLNGLKTSQDVSHFIRLTEELGLFEQIFPGLAVDTTQLAPADPIAQLASMLKGNDSKKLRQTLKQMKYTNVYVDTIDFLLALSAITKESAPALKKQFNRLKTPPVVLHDFSRLTGTPSPQALEAFIQFASAPPAANPKDLMAQGLKGPDIGLAMADAEKEAYGMLVGEIRQYVRRVLLREAAKDPSQKACQKKNQNTLKALEQMGAVKYE